MSKFSSESYLKMIAEVMAESKKTYLSQDEIYKRIYRKWHQFSNMKTYGWKNRIDHVLIDNECFEHDDNWNWRLHPACREMVRVGNYTQCDINNLVRLNGQSALDAEDIPHCPQQNDHNKKLLDSPLAQQKKQHLEESTTYDDQKLQCPRSTLPSAREIPHAEAEEFEVIDIRPVENYQAIVDACDFSLVHNDTQETVDSEAIQTDDEDYIPDYQFQGGNDEGISMIRNGVIDIRPIRMFNATVYEFVNLW